VRRLTGTGIPGRWCKPLHTVMDHVLLSGGTDLLAANRAELTTAAQPVQWDCPMSRVEYAVRVSLVRIAGRHRPVGPRGPTESSTRSEATHRTQERRQEPPGDYLLATYRLSIWSGWRDSNSRPPEPHSGALPGCATSRFSDCIPTPRFRASTTAGGQAFPARPFHVSRGDDLGCRPCAHRFGTQAIQLRLSGWRLGCPGPRRGRQQIAQRPQLVLDRDDPLSGPAVDRNARRGLGNVRSQLGVDPPPHPGERQPFREHHVLDAQRQFDVRPAIGPRRPWSPCDAKPRELLFP
jgi:hypothetical protein